MGFDRCLAIREESAAFVLGDSDAHTRADVVGHLDACSSCRWEVSSLAAAVDSMSTLAPPVEPSPGFVERVLAAARADLTLTPDDLAPPVWVSTPLAKPRPVAVVARRRRTLAWLTGGAIVVGLLGAAYQSAILLALGGAAGLLAAAYLGLVTWITHSKARHDIVAAFHSTEVRVDSFWSELEPRLLSRSGLDDRRAGPVVAVRNTALVHFVLSYFLGWALTPVVGLIRLFRGDLAGIEQSPRLAQIVAMQRRGRDHSLRLLVAGATTVAVAGGGTGAAMMMSPGLAAASPAVQTYTVRAGDTLGAIAERYGVSVSSLAQLNGLSDPNLILPGDVLQLAGQAVGAPRSTAATPSAPATPSTGSPPSSAPRPPPSPEQTTLPTRTSSWRARP